MKEKYNGLMLAFVLAVTIIHLSGCIKSEEEERAEDARHTANVAKDRASEVHGKSLSTYTGACESLGRWTDAGYNADENYIYGSDGLYDRFNRVDEKYDKVCTAYSRALEMHSRAWNHDTPEAWNEARKAWNQVAKISREVY